MLNKRLEKELIQFGQRVKDRRKNLKMTQLDLELSTGINRTEISKIENGLKNIEFLTIVKLAIALEVEISDLFSEDKKGEKP